MAAVTTTSDATPLSNNEQIIDQVKGFLQKVLQDKISSSINRPEYILVVNQIYKKDDPETLHAILIALKCFTTQLTSRPETFRELLTAIFSYDWKADLKTNLAALDLIANLVFTNAVFLISAFELFAHSFVSLKKDLSLLPAQEQDAATSQSTHDEEYKLHIHETIKKILACVPMGQSKLFPVLRRSFPHKRFSKQILVEYTTNVLKVCHYLPMSQFHVLDVVVQRCLELDVEIVIEDSGEVRLQRDLNNPNDEDDDGFILYRAKDESNIIHQLNSKRHDDNENEDEDDLIFGFEDDITTTTSTNGHSRNALNNSKVSVTATSTAILTTVAATNLTNKPRIADEVSESAEKLDDLLVTLLQFFETVLTPTPTTEQRERELPATTKRTEQQQRLFQHLLKIFETRLITAHKSKFVQFILFFVAARDHHFAELLARRMMEIVKDETEASINRQSAVMYLASYLSRANFLPLSFIRNLLAELIRWAAHYVLLHNAQTVSLTSEQALPFWTTDHSASKAGAGRQHAHQMTHAMNKMHLHAQKHQQRGQYHQGNAAFVHAVEYDEYGRLHVVEHTAAHHELFYAILQSTCYILCFHGLECIQGLQQMSSTCTNNNSNSNTGCSSNQSLSYDMALAWEIILSSKFDPLKYCLHSVSTEFLKLARAVRLCKSVSSDPTAAATTAGEFEYKQDRSNSTNSIGNSSIATTHATMTDTTAYSSVYSSGQHRTTSTTTTSNTVATALGPFSLDSFFPFDPCLLRKVHSYIEESYRSWRGVPGIDDEQSQYQSGFPEAFDEEIDDEEYYTEGDDVDEDDADADVDDIDEDDLQVDDRGIPIQSEGIAMSLASSYAQSTMAKSLSMSVASYHNSSNFENNYQTAISQQQMQITSDSTSMSIQYNNYQSVQRDYSYLRGQRDSNSDNELDDEEIVEDTGVRHIISNGHGHQQGRQVVNLDQMSAFGVGLPNSNLEHQRERRPRFNSIGSSSGW